MSLDILNLDTQAWLHSIDSEQFQNLQDIFTTFYHRTGIMIDECGNTRLDIDNHRLLVEIISDYVEKTDLNRNFSRTKTVLEFSGLLSYFIDHAIQIEIVGD